MNRQERVGDPNEMLLLAMRGALSEVWTALPGVIQSFDAVAMTCTVQPAIQVRARAPDGTESSLSLPLLVDCPVQFPAGGNCTLTFPVTSGDECLIVFGSRCIDGWWQSSGVQAQAEPRMHDLSDGFVLLGTRSRPRALSGVSTASAQLRSDDGATFIDLNPLTKKISIVAPGGLDVVTPLATFSQAVTIGGLLTFIGGMVGSATSGAAAVFNGVLNVIGQIAANGKRVDDTHTHNNVQPGSGNSGTVN